MSVPGMPPALEEQRSLALFPPRSFDASIAQGRDTGIAGCWGNAEMPSSERPGAVPMLQTIDRCCAHARGGITRLWSRLEGVRKVARCKLGIQPLCSPRRDAA